MCAYIFHNIQIIALLEVGLSNCTPLGSNLGFSHPAPVVHINTDIYTQYVMYRKLNNLNFDHLQTTT